MINYPVDTDRDQWAPILRILLAVALCNALMATVAFALMSLN
jgi:hypothetical protein